MDGMEKPRNPTFIDATIRSEPNDPWIVISISLLDKQSLTKYLSILFGITSVPVMVLVRNNSVPDTT